MCKAFDFILWPFYVQLILSQKLFLIRELEIEIDEFEESPLDLGPDISKDEIVKIFAIFIENVPSSSDDFFPLRLTSLIMQPFHNPFQKTDIDNF